MLKHENPHIEIINRELWAVRFSLIPLIPQINITHREGTEPAESLNDLELSFTPEGIMVLNKDNKRYSMFRDAACRVMKLNDRNLAKELLRVSKIPPAKPFEVIFRYVLMAEAERRKIKKGVQT